MIPFSQDFLVFLCDENAKNVELKLGRPTEKIELTFYVSHVMFEFFFVSDHWLEEYAEDKVKEFLDLEKERTAYSINVKRAEALSKDNYDFAALILLVTAFENILRELFFRNNEFWFVEHFHRGHDDLYRKYGIMLDDSSDSDRFKIVEELKGVRYGFDDTGHNLKEKWEDILERDEVFNVCRKLNVYDAYVQKLFSNSLNEIGLFEILKAILEEYSPINFQRLRGAGGAIWAFTTFFYINFAPVNSELNTIEENLKKRHILIHSIQDSEVTKEEVNEFKTAINRVVAFIENEILTWRYVLP